MEPGKVKIHQKGIYPGRITNDPKQIEDKGGLKMAEKHLFRDGSRVSTDSFGACSLPGRTKATFRAGQKEALEVVFLEVVFVDSTGLLASNKLAMAFLSILRMTVTI